MFLPYQCSICIFFWTLLMVIALGLSPGRVLAVSEFTVAFCVLSHSFSELYGLHFTSASPVWMSWICAPLASGFCCRESLSRMIFTWSIHYKYFLISSQNFSDVHFVIVARSVCLMALTRESFLFQGGTAAPEIHVWSNSRPNGIEKKTWSASLSQQFGEGKAFDEKRLTLILF